MLENREIKSRSKLSIAAHEVEAFLIVSQPACHTKLLKNNSIMPEPASNDTISMRSPSSNANISDLNSLLVPANALYKRIQN